MTTQNEDLTPVLNERSIEYVRSMIQRKNGHLPFYSNGQDVKMSITDYDHFPYTRYFRGVAGVDRPIIAEKRSRLATSSRNLLYCKLTSSC